MDLGPEWDDGTRRKGDIYSDRMLAGVTAALLIMALIGFVISFWDRGALAMGFSCLIVAIITGVAWARFPKRPR